MSEQAPLRRNYQDHNLMAFAAAKAEGKPWALITSQEISATLGLTELQTARLLSRLVAKKSIQQLRRGLYITPARPSPGKLWTPSPYEALWAYMDWLGATWQITGYAAFTRYGFSTQVVQRLAVYNDKLNGEEYAGGNRYVFYKVPKSYLGFTREFPMQSGIAIVFSSKARTLFDAITETKKFAALPEAYAWFTQILSDKEEIASLKKIALALGSRQTVARIGFILEYLGVDASELLPRVQGSSTLVPIVPGARRGPINKRWGIILNKDLNKIFLDVEAPDEDEQ
jgi:predicted transcriptional regulator of viral defense system